MRTLATLATPHGEARAHLHPAEQPWATLVLGHGAGGGIGAVDLVAAADRLPAAGVDVVLVEQPWRVAGRRVASPPRVLDEAFAAVVDQLAPAPPFVIGGRSAGARVGCRVGATVGASGVLALAFPLQPPDRPAGKARTAELVAAGLPALVVQGDRDPFGGPADVRAALAPSPPSSEVRVVEVPAADHTFTVRAADGGARARGLALADAMDAVLDWLRTAVAPSGP